MQKIFSIIQTTFLVIFFLSLFLIPSFFIINISSYFDPISLCFIGIKGDVVSGEEKTIHQALKLIKKDNTKEYKNICNFVSIIVETKYCKIGDARVDTSLPNSGRVDPPCYIKGSKIIYLKSEKEISDDIISKRANNIIEFARHSQNFWQNL